MIDSPDSNWPPEGFVKVGDYAFKPPYIPSQLQLEQAEQFIFTNVRFSELEESQRRRNVIRLAVAAATSYALDNSEGSQQQNVVPLLGGVVRIIAESHEGTPVFFYELLENRTEEK